MMEINKIFKKFDHLKFIKKSSVYILILFLVLCIPTIKNFILSFDNNSLLELLKIYKKEKDIIFSLLNIIILITIYEMFVSGENKKQNQNKFLIKRLSIVEKNLDEINILLNAKLEQEEQKKIRIAIKKIAYTINALVDLLKEKKIEDLKVEFEKFKNQFDGFNQDFQDSLLDKKTLDNMKFQRKINVLENECLRIESKIL